MVIGILGLQGSFFNHQKQFESLGIKTIIVKKICELEQIDGLVLPGGESTAMRKLIDKYNFLEPLKLFGKNKPIYGTCAGMILLANKVSDDISHLQLLDVTVKRNAFGRQVDSFEETLVVKGIGKDIPAVYIRAPYITNIGSNVQILSQTKDGFITAVREGNILATSFHPELTNDKRVAEYFTTIVQESL